MHTYLALGDSYTIGESVPLPESFPHLLAAQLVAQGLPVLPPQIIATTGWTTDELQEAIQVENPAGPFDFVTLLIGVNNQYRGYSMDVYRQEFTALLDQAIGFAGGRADHVFVVSIPDWGVTPFGKASGRPIDQISASIDAFNAVNREESERRQVSYTDITPGSRAAAADLSLVAVDGLHYSAKMHEQWALAVAAKVARCLTP